MDAANDVIDAAAGGDGDAAAAFENNHHHQHGDLQHLFAERDEALACIQSLTTTTIRSSPSSTKGQHDDDDNGEDPRDAALQHFRTIADKYLECPTLLDQSLEEMVQPLSQWVQQCLQHIRTTTENESLNSENIPPRFIIAKIQHALSALYALSKVRGRKCVQRFLPHGVQDVEPVWMGLQMVMAAAASISSASKSNNQQQQQSLSSSLLKPPLWESAYVLWTWMGVLSLVPFDSQVIVAVDDNEQQSQQQHLVARIGAAACRGALADAGPVRSAASVCLAAWLSRPDREAQQQMAAFVGWSKPLLVQYCGCTSKNNKGGATNSNLFRILGILQTLTALLKGATVDRAILVEKILHPLWDTVLQLADSKSNSNNVLLQKLLVKWWTRASCAALPPRAAAPWRYQRGQRSLLLTPAASEKENSKHRTPAAADDHNNDFDKSVATNSYTLDVVVDDDDNDDLFDVPDQVEDAMGRILETLSHSSTIARWSAAKGVGRITERLPAPCGHDVLDDILTLFEDNDDDAYHYHHHNGEHEDRGWHGACLALAELARRGLVPPSRLHQVVPQLVRAVQYDRRKGPTSVGTHVRDAACYTYWAMARSYSATTLRPYLGRLNQAIVLTSLLDREVNCRRAASAAFQEAVGRQGATNVPHGIEILTTADFFALGNRNDAYLGIARRIAEFEEHRKPIIRHLSTCKLFHWDGDIRLLASKSLHNLTSLDTGFICKSVLPDLLEKCLDVKDLYIRHGALLGTAEIILALSELNQMAMLFSNTEKSLVELVPAIEKKRLFRGKGGEIMRSAVCRFIECLSIARIKLDVREQVRLLDSVDANIPHPSEPISLAASRALESLLSVYFPVGDKGPSQRLQKRVVDRFVEELSTSENPAVARGYALALGHLPAKLLAPTKEILIKVVSCLRQTANPKSLVGGEGDAETRRNALLSLIQITRTVGFTIPLSVTYPVIALDAWLVSAVFGTFLASLGDYNSDRRGDVGSWCRMVAMDGGTDLLLTCDNSERASSYLNESDATHLVAALLKQLSERLDTVRQKAGDCLVRLLSLTSSASVSPSQKAALADALGLSEAEDYLSWKDASAVFPKVMAAASLPETLYFDSVLAGISYSLGSRGDKVGNTASVALVRWAKQQSSTDVERLGFTLLRLLETNRGVGRIVLPVLKTFDALFSHGCLDELTQRNNAFSDRCLSVLQKEAPSNEIGRLFAIVDVTVALLFVLPRENSISRRGLAFLCSMLAHPFPRFRSYAAEQFYVFLLEYESGERAKAIDLVLSTPWSSELPSTERQKYSTITALELDVLTELEALY